MSLFNAVWEPIRAKLFGARGGSKQVTSLIEEFQYPKYGPGMMWERCTELVTKAGSPVHFEQKVTRISRDDSGATEVAATSPDGSETTYPATEIISSMPFARLVDVLDPPPPADVVEAAHGLTFRDFLTVALVVPESDGFPDNWIYIHSPDVHVGRIQNFGQWSPYMVKDGRACLGLEYFVFEGDGMWTMDDDELVELAKTELGRLGLTDPQDRRGRLRGADAEGLPRLRRGLPRARSRRLRDWLTEAVPNLHPVGATACTSTTTRITPCSPRCSPWRTSPTGTDLDIWSVNVEADYHETDDDPASPGSEPPTTASTGRDAPVVPKR